MRKIVLLCSLLISIFSFSIVSFAAEDEGQASITTNLIGKIEHVPPERNSDRPDSSSGLPSQNDYFSYFIVKAVISDTINNYRSDVDYTGVIYYRIVVDVNISSISTGRNTFLDSVELVDLYGIDGNSINFTDVKSWSGTAASGYTVKLGGVWTRYIDSSQPEVSERELYVKYKLKWQSEGFPHYSTTNNWESIISDAQNVFWSRSSKDALLHDNSGVSDLNESARVEYDNIESQAHSAIDEAEAANPTYDAALDEVSEFNSEGFFNGQLEAVQFWQRLGNWILDSSNLSFISTALIIVTLITLFVYLLRL